MLPTNLRFCQHSCSAGAATSRRAASLSCRLPTIFPSHQLCPPISALFRRPGVTAAPCTLYTRLRDRYFIFGGSLKDSTVPADLLKLKTQLEAWRATRRYARQPIPDEFRQAAADMAGRYSPSLVRRILKLDPVGYQLQKTGLYQNYQVQQTHERHRVATHRSNWTDSGRGTPPNFRMADDSEVDGDKPVSRD
jgi:hypothetical protein